MDCKVAFAYLRVTLAPFAIVYMYAMDNPVYSLDDLPECNMNIKVSMDLS